MVRVNFIKTEDIKDKIEMLFESEKTRLSALLPHVQIEHIGSTAVLDTISKGDLDINIRVGKTDFGNTIKILKKLYVINQPNNWTKDFASFKDDAKNLGIQLTVLGSEDDYFVAQRDYLREHPEKVTALNALKEKFEGRDMDEYRAEKNQFFESLI